MTKTVQQPLELEVSSFDKQAVAESTNNKCTRYKVDSKSTNYGPYTISGFCYDHQMAFASSYNLYTIDFGTALNMYEFSQNCYDELQVH
jgi:hypothetical protein